MPGARPLAFCAGLLHPRVYVSTGAVQRLSEDELAAVVEHEAHHARRRDPLRILIARAIGEAYALTALPRREQALAELAADAAAVRRRGAAPLAAALLAFDAAAIAPERVDRLVGTPPNDEVPRALVAGAGLVIVALVALIALACCCTRASACRWPRRRRGRCARSPRASWRWPRRGSVGAAPGRSWNPPRRSAKRSPSVRAWRGRSPLPLDA